MNEAFVIIMRLKEGDLCCLIHRVYSLDGPIILIIANRCSEVILKKKKILSHCVKKVKVSLCKPHYPSN